MATGTTTMLNKVACLVFLAMAVVAPPTQAISCGQVVQSLIPCLGYLTSGGQVPSACCSGIQSLNKAANTTPARRQACVCIKQAAQAYGAINYDYAGSLPGKCGVNLGIKITPSVDCSRVR